MHEAISIRILEEGSNRRGDLFGQLMADLFVALGYEQPRVNIHKPGRELDLSTNHRLEPRRAIAECKATVEAVGGAEVNKFVGVLDAEWKQKPPVTGYFISLGGFTETAIEQEQQGRRTKIILLTGPKVVEELIKGHVLIGRERASDLAGRLCADCADLVLDPAGDLLAHERGWIWTVYYTQGNARTHFALIHADGTPLNRTIADEVIAVDRACGGQLHELLCLNPAPPYPTDSELQVEDALAAYGRYLAEECGFIQLDGLPADSDVSSRRLRLENLFVPLHLDVTSTKGARDAKDDGSTEQMRSENRNNRQSVGGVLGEHPRLALLAAPGGGKSTLMKRLAVAYADPTRHSQIADDLPRRACLPLFFRCRELRDLARGSFSQLLDALSQREPVRIHAEAFRAHVDRELLAGRVLLLVDGLDELSDPGDRAALVCTLRTALHAYPGTSIVVTSREAGFRHVAAHLAPVCTQATLSPFDADDICRMSVAWHREVVGDSEKVRRDAEQLAATIAGNDRIRRLAVNPLLLTTLLLVKRWVGSLPTRRAVLYGKAVEVLLMTWNTEGHEPIPDEEALPQLCYVASAMMIAGVQSISRPRLASLIRDARVSLPTELGYVKGTVEEFIHRVEDRSSLLMMTGHDIEDGQLVEFFEFRHLTFQEFLTARAMVAGWHPGRKEDDTLASVLEPYLGKEKWLEVIPLAAVLGGRATEELIQRLTEKLATDKAEDTRSLSSLLSCAFSTLTHCLADEAAARPETIRAAMRALVQFPELWHIFELFQLIARGRYGADLRDEARKAFLATPSVGVGTVLSAAILPQISQTTDAASCLQAVEQLRSMLSSAEAISRCEGALGCLRLVVMLRERQSKADVAACVEFLETSIRELTSMLVSDSPAEQFGASWALALIGDALNTPPTADPDVLGRLLLLWQNSPDANVREMASFALAYLPLDARGDLRRFASISRTDFLRSLHKYEQAGGPSPHSANRYDDVAVLIVAWYLNAPWSHAELGQRARALLNEAGRLEGNPLDKNLHALLHRLGEGIAT